MADTCAPDNYTPNYCDAVNNAFVTKMNGVEQKVEKVDGRLWTVILLAVGNLLAALGGAIGLLLK